MKDSEHGQGFSMEEISDTVFTLLLGGKLATKEALPSLMVQLHKHRSWVGRLADEAAASASLDMQGVEEDSVTLRVVREALRMRPPATLRRVNYESAMDLGPHGVIPKASWWPSGTLYPFFWFLVPL